MELYPSAFDGKGPKLFIWMLRWHFYSEWEQQHPGFDKKDLFLTADTALQKWGDIFLKHGKFLEYSEVTIFSNISVSDGTVSCEERLRELCLLSPEEVSYPCAWISDVGVKGMEPGCSQWCPATGQETMSTNWNRVGEKELTAFYRVKVVRHWHKLNREGRKSPSLEISNIHQAQPRPACCCSLPELGVALGNLQKYLPTLQTFVILYYQTYSEAIYYLEA